MKPASGKPHPRRADRREFLTAAPRALLLGGLAALSATLGKRSISTPCVSDGRCRACGVFTACALEPAELLRRRIREDAG
ncbi:MAG: hypothetical protein O2923_02100 [Verrucomicrobia bacterium]|nr:hypothetical protein [Verrucomicrobiota bacterium]MDA1085975.1 hypothetical protein [Verrucomicrobiota bacterium]